MPSKAPAAGVAGPGQLIGPQLGAGQDTELVNFSGSPRWDPPLTPRPGQSPPRASPAQLFEELQPSCQSSGKQTNYL